MKLRCDNKLFLQNIAATVVPTLVDPKRRVRQASQECVAILAAFMGPSKAAPLIRSIELLESHFERGAGVLNAVQARLSRRYSSNSIRKTFETCNQTNRWRHHNICQFG